MKPNQLASKLYDSISASDEPRVIESWHASSIAQCPKAQYMQRLGIGAYARPTGAKVLRWKAGHIIEQVIRPHLQGIYPLLISNIRVSNKKYDLTGEFDNYYPTSKSLIEIKSVGPRAVRYKRVGEDSYNLRDDKPYLGHELQQHVYELLMKTPGSIIEIQDADPYLEGRDPSEIPWLKPVTASWALKNGVWRATIIKPIEVESITYLYITLEGLLVPYMTPVKPELTREVLNRLDVLNTAWAAQTPPECVCVKSHMLWGSVTQFCDYRSENGCCEMPKEAK